MPNALVEPVSELSEEEVAWYARHLRVPQLGTDGQRRLRDARVLVVGAGGLGSPVLMYLAAAGVGTIGIADADRVEASNLQRQIVHGAGDVGRPKVESARDRLNSINPFVQVTGHRFRVDGGNVAELVSAYHLVVDASDNFTTRYLLNHACVARRIPLVWGCVYRFEGQVSVWWAGHGPCLRCAFPTPPPPEDVLSCAEGGIVGITCAAVGAAQAAEAVKLITGAGEPLLGRIQVHDVLRPAWLTLRTRPDPECPVCGPDAAGRDWPDYDAFCRAPAGSGRP